MKKRVNMSPQERDAIQRMEKTCRIYRELIAAGMKPSRAKIETAHRTGQALTTVYNHIRIAASRERGEA